MMDERTEATMRRSVLDVIHCSMLDARDPVPLRVVCYDPDFVPIKHTHISRPHLPYRTPRGERLRQQRERDLCDDI